MATVSSFLAVPDLTASAARLDPAFVARYLRAPLKVRPTLPEGMLRTGFTEDEATAVAAWLSSAAPVRLAESPLASAAAALSLSSAAADVAAGKKLFDELACATCHALAGRLATAAGPPAPDLVFIRERMRPETAAAFIADPRALGGDPRMPVYPMTATQAAQLRDFLWATAGASREPLLPISSPRASARGGRSGGGSDESLNGPSPRSREDLLDRPVGYAEVRAAVLDRICIHCHMDPRRNGGDGGPGNTGGLGYRGAGLDLESWAGIVRGARDARGRRVSILAAPSPGGEPLLVARLRRRYAEHAAELRGPAAVTTGGAPGMPLGLPPLSPEQFRLVRSWVAQGAPGPVTAAARRRPVVLKVSARTAEDPKQ
jgi:mono/diheme cytochrome c family protein